MNTRGVDPRTLWAVLAMEAALALPIISLPTQGDRLPGSPGPVLLVALLPLGFVAVHQLARLRDPSWRLLSGIGLALLTRAIVSSVPEQSFSGWAIWFASSLVPAAIGVGLWWRGGALCVAELTPAEVRTEFSVLAICMLAVLSLVRPFLLPDPVLLGGSVGLFAVAGLISAALARQDAADLASVRSGRALAMGVAVLPAGAAVLLVSALRPELLGTVWLTLARVIELILTPIGLFLAWLGSLFPRVAVAPPPTPVPIPTPAPLPDTDALAAAQDRLAWLGWLLLFALLLAVAAAAVFAAAMLLQNWIGSPARAAERVPAGEIVAERTGDPGGDAQALLAWLLGWLRARFRRGTSTRRSTGKPSAEDVSPDVWLEYQRLLLWAETHGLGRRPAETMGQLQARLSQYAPDAADTVDLVTRTYESERYGARHPPRDRLRRVQAALSALFEK
jgi:hypothetical protein